MSVRNQNPGTGTSFISWSHTPEARQTLAKIRSLTRLEAWIRCAKAELASTPQDELLAEFIRATEKMANDEREKLLAA